MSESRNGWDAWYTWWDKTYADRDDSFALDIIPYTSLASWGEEFCRYVMLNDHWTGYLHPGPMSLEDGMSIAFVLYDVGVNVDDLLDVLSSFHPIQSMPVDVTIPLCWLTEPMDHVQDLLDMLADVGGIDPEVFEQMQEMLEETVGEAPLSAEELPDMFRAMMVSTVQWLLEMARILGENGMIALRAWWQGRLITVLRETSTPRRERGRRRGRPGSGEMPSAFQDLIQSLDFRGLGTDEEDDLDEDESAPFTPDGAPGRY